MEHFSLVLTGPKKGQISYIQNSEKIAEVICLPSTVTCTCILTHNYFADHVQFCKVACKFDFTVIIFITYFTILTQCCFFTHRFTLTETAAV